MIHADLHEKGSRVVLKADDHASAGKLERTIDRLPFAISAGDWCWIISLYDLWLFKDFIGLERPLKLSMTKRLRDKVSLLSGPGPALPELNLKRPLLPFHIDGVQFMTSRNALMADTMGLGKSAQTIAAYRVMQKRGLAKHAIFLVTKSGLEHWCEQIDIMFDDMEYVVVEGKPKDRLKIYKEKHQVYIVSLDTFKRDATKLSPGHNKALKKIWTNSVVVVDEVHRIKHCNTVAAKACYKIARYAPWRWGLSGTPLDGRVENLYGVMAFLDRDFFINKKVCLDYHAELDFWGNVATYKNMDELNTKLKTLMIRRLKENVWKELPDKTYQDHFIDLSKDEKKLYQQIKKQEMDMLSDEVNEKINLSLPVTLLTYGQSCTDTPALLDPNWTKPSTKMLECHEILSELTPVSKVVIFTKFARMCHILHEWLPWRSEVFTGELTHKERKVRQDRFLTNPDVRVFIMDTAGAQAIDLHGKMVDDVWHQGADYLIRYDSLWNPAMNAQVEDRIHRIGQTEQVTIIDLICRGTVEERVRKALRQKQYITQRIIEGKITRDQCQDLM